MTVCAPMAHNPVNTPKRPPPTMAFASFCARLARVLNVCFNLALSLALAAFGLRVYTTPDYLVKLASAAADAQPHCTACRDIYGALARTDVGVPAHVLLSCWLALFAVLVPALAVWNALLDVEAVKDSEASSLRQELLASRLDRLQLFLHTEQLQAARDAGVKPAVETDGHVDLFKLL